MNIIKSYKNTNNIIPADKKLRVLQWHLGTKRQENILFLEDIIFVFSISIINDIYFLGFFE